MGVVVNENLKIKYVRRKAPRGSPGLLVSVGPNIYKTSTQWCTDVPLDLRIRVVPI